MNWITDRLKEKTTWAGLAQIGYLAVTTGDPLAALAGVAAMVIPEGRGRAS